MALALNVLVVKISTPASDDFGARDVEQVVIAFERSGEIGKLFATVIRFGQFKALYHRPHPSVEDQDALVK